MSAQLSFVCEPISPTAFLHTRNHTSFCCLVCMRASGRLRKQSLAKHGRGKRVTLRTHRTGR